MFTNDRFRRILAFFLIGGGALLLLASLYLPSRTMWGYVSSIAGNLALIFFGLMLWLQLRRPKLAAVFSGGALILISLALIAFMVDLRSR